MSGGKYLVMSNGEHGSEFSVIFNETESHKLMARKLGGEDKVLGAGFVSVGESSTNGRYVNCWGKSDSLKKGSRGREDAFTVAFALFGTTSDVDLGT